MARYAQGDAEAFSVVYDFVGPRLAAFARRRCRNETLVEDLVHETFARMIRWVHTFAAGSEVLPWARAILRRLIADPTHRRREQGRELLIEVDDRSLRGDLLSVVARADDLFEAKRLASVISAAFSRLRPPQRDAFELVKLEGRSIRQAAAELGATELGVRLRVHRAMKSLRRAIAAATSNREEAPPDQMARSAEKRDGKQVAQEQVRQVSDRTPEVYENAGPKADRHAESSAGGPRGDDLRTTKRQRKGGYRRQSDGESQCEAPKAHPPRPEPDHSVELSAQEVTCRDGHQGQAKNDAHPQRVRASEHRTTSGEQHSPGEPGDQSVSGCRRDNEEGRSWPRPGPSGQEEHEQPEQRAAQQDHGAA
jgi:RNA polymerase sigma-70 factor (ECF subfamily)